MTKIEKIKKVIDSVVREFGRNDFMFNNAGMRIGGEIRDLEPEHWQKMIDVNFNGVLYGTQAAYRHMIK